MARARRFSPAVIRQVRAQKYFGIRAGSTHRFIGIWTVDVDGRVFARSWTIKRTGWRQALLDDPVGEIQVGDRTLRMRARPVTSERLKDAVSDAYFAKYTTTASLAYCRGFARGRRRETTMELLPR